MWGIFSRKKQNNATHLRKTNTKTVYYDNQSIDEINNIQLLDQRFLETDVENWLLCFLRRRIAIHASITNMPTDYIAAKVGDSGRKYKWLHPDIIVAEFRWNKDQSRQAAFQALDKIGRPKVRISCFETKRTLPLKMHNNEDVWRYFFQAVRNSLWANRSWLVFADHDPDQDEIKAYQMMFEIERMCQQSRIGLIRVHPDEANYLYTPPSDPIETKSRIVFPAPERTELNWDGAEILIKNNSAVANFFAKVGEITDNPEVFNEMRWNLEDSFIRLS